MSCFSFAPAVLALEDGSIFRGRSIGSAGQTVGEVVFNTSMTGYQEILTDPSYAEQIVVLTYPHVGNVGVNVADVESTRVQAAGLVIRDLSIAMSNWRAELDLGSYLAAEKCVAIAGIDTRRLTRILRTSGSLHGAIVADTNDPAAALAAARHFEGLRGRDLAAEVSRAEPGNWREPPCNFERNDSDTESHPRVAVIDYGVKHNILRQLVAAGFSVRVFPAQSSAEDILSWQPEGIVLSNGPGDPQSLVAAQQTIARLLRAELPVLGICLGHQLLALAVGAKTTKMSFGHHGANHPVRDERTGRVVISSQNHCYAVVDELPDEFEITHVSLFDDSVQGIRHRRKPWFGFQGHPEASPGPHDLSPLFEEFATAVRKSRSRAQA